MGHERKKSLHFSKLYSFSCLRNKFEDDHSQIGKKGYSRVVYCNDSESVEALELSYKGNYVSTTKYTAVNFLPKSLFEQFRRVANIYFLVVACVSFSPLAPYSAMSVLLPLIVVIGATMVKEAVEDWRRKQQVVFFENVLLVKNVGFFCLKNLSVIYVGCCRILRQTIEKFMCIRVVLVFLKRDGKTYELEIL